MDKFLDPHDKRSYLFGSGTALIYKVICRFWGNKHTTLAETLASRLINEKRGRDILSIPKLCEFHKLIFINVIPRNIFKNTAAGFRTNILFCCTLTSDTLYAFLNCFWVATMEFQCRGKYDPLGMTFENRITIAELTF